MKTLNRTISIFLACCLMLGILGQGSRAYGQSLQTIQLQNPIEVEDASMEAGKKVTYDCVWFGSYPQAEVVPSREDYYHISEEALTEGDLIVDANLYKALQVSEIWDENDDAQLNGERYHRLNRESATYSAVYDFSDFYYDDDDLNLGALLYDNHGYYVWNENEGLKYSYFKYQPLKWRVLEVKDGKALLLADKGIDTQSFNVAFSDTVTWENCTLRGWLNGYSVDQNEASIDYSNKNFLQTAFNANERTAIVRSVLSNYYSYIYSVPTCGDTEDFVYLLAMNDVMYTAFKDAIYKVMDYIPGRGFNYYGGVADEAKRAKTTTYAKAMGCYSHKDSEYCSVWQLRNRGYNNGYGGTFSVAAVEPNGTVYDAGTDMVAGRYPNCLRPALTIDVNSIAYSYAGQICTDGTVYEIPFTLNNGIVLSESFLQQTENTKKQLTATVFVDSQIVENPEIVWESSDPSVATVENGLVKVKKYQGVAMITATYDSMTASCLLVAKDSVVDTAKRLTLDYGDNLSITVDWSPQLFKNSSEKFNEKLAYLGLWLSGNANYETDSSHIQNALKKMGFKNVKSEFYSSKFLSDPSVNAHTFGAQEVRIDGKKKLLVTCVSRGTQGATEVLYKDVIGGQFNGFLDMSKTTKNNLLAYISSVWPNYNKDDIILFLTGHSMGGGVTGQLARMLDQEGFAKSSTFVYTFASTLYDIENANQMNYPNVFNIINNQDIIPKLPLFQHRVGKDYIYVLDDATYIDAMPNELPKLYDIPAVIGSTFEIVLGMHSISTYFRALRDCIRMDADTGLLRLSNVTTFCNVANIIVRDKDGSIVSYTQNEQVHNLRPNELLIYRNGLDITVVSFAGKEYDIIFSDVLANSNISGTTLQLNATTGDITKESTFSSATIKKGGEYIYQIYDAPNKGTLLNSQGKKVKLTVKKTVSNVTPSKVSSAKAKALTVTWKKNANVDGYEIEYATDKAFTKNVESAFVNKVTTTKKTISKLKSGKKYFVRIRGYKESENGKTFSDWSKVQNVTVK